MSVKTGCPHCGTELKLKSDKSVGRKVPCPKCSTSFVVKVLDEPAADEERDEYDDYSEQDYGSSYDDYEDVSSSARGSSRSTGNRSSGSKRAASNRSKSRTSGSKKKRASNAGPNWALIGGGIVGVLVLVFAAFAFWPSGDSVATDDAATTRGDVASAGSETPSRAVTLGPYVSFLDGNLRLQQPAGFEVTNPPGNIVQGFDQFAGFGRRDDFLCISIQSNGMPVERLVNTIAPETPDGTDRKILSRTVTKVDGKTDVLCSIESQGTAGRFFSWTRIRGDSHWTVMVDARMPFDEQATYSEPFKQVLQNAQFGPPALNEETAPVTESAAPLAETEVNGIKLVPRKFLDGRIEMLAPAEFTAMSDEMARLKYPTANRPSEIITDEFGAVNLAFTYSKQIVAPGQLGQMHNSMDGMFRTMHKTAEWHNSGMRTINGRQWAEIDVTIQVSDTRVRNLMYVTSSGGRAAMITFNVTVERLPQWAEAAQAMISSMHALD